MNEPIAKIQVQNPALIAALTPLVATLPMTLNNVDNHLSPIVKHWVMGSIAIIYLALFIFFVRVGLKKTYLILQTDGLQFSNRQYSVDQIQKIKYNKRTRYLQVKTRPAIRSINVYLGNRDESPEKIVMLEQWATQTGVIYRS